MKEFLKKVGCSIPIIIYVGLLVFGVITTISSCSKPRVADVDDSYYEGYDEGYYDGYYDGVEEAKQYIAFAVDDDLSSLSWDIEDEYGMYPEDAVRILSNYADKSAEVDEEELNDAIWAIYRYYHKSNEVVNAIEDYDID